MSRGQPLWREWGTPEASPLARKLQARVDAGLPVQDFITANPYDHGFRFDADLLKEVLAEAGARSARYSADPLGCLAARKVIAARHGNSIIPTQVLLTPGTSLAYFYLFRLLAREHGEVLCPAPTYPLFDDLAKIAGLRVRRYHLDKTTDASGTTRWVIDPMELEFQITPRTCAIVLVSPHNPTGTIINETEMGAICEVANRANVPLIMDEVFRSYTRLENAQVPRPGSFGSRLSYTLNGLSKSHYLPGLKAGWIVVEGETAAYAPMLNALEYMQDSFLPVQEITQAAIPNLLGSRAMTEVYRLSALQRARLEGRLGRTVGWNVSIPEAGPYLCASLEQPKFSDENQLVEFLLEEHGSHFHPGYFYAFPKPCFVSTLYNDNPWPTSIASLQL